MGNVKIVSGLLAKGLLLPGRLHWQVWLRVGASERKKAPPPAPTLARVGAGGGARCVRGYRGSQSAVASTRASRHTLSTRTRTHVHCCTATSNGGLITRGSGESGGGESGGETLAAVAVAGGGGAGGRR